MKASNNFNIGIHHQMTEIQVNSSLPRILNRRNATEGRDMTNRLSLPSSKKNSLHLKTELMGNQYRKAIIQHGRQYDRIKHIFTKNQRIESNDEKEDLLMKMNRSMAPPEIQKSQEREEGQEKKEICQTEVSKKESEQMEVLTETENYYNLNLKNQQPNLEKLRNFIEMLSINNVLFSKTNPIVAETLLKLGFVTTYHSKQVIYQENAPIRNIGILLWGQATMRKRSTRLKMSLLPGFAIGQQLIFQKLDYNFKRKALIDKGEFFTTEKCKANISTGILFIGEKQYNLVYEQLAKSGYKDIILKFQRLLLRTYLKKRETRNLLG